MPQARGGRAGAARRILGGMAGGTLVRELAAGALVDATFAVSRKERRTRRDGRPFLDLELTDRSGRIRARVWDGVPVLEQRFDVGDTVRVLGRVGEYAGRVELEVRDVERVEGGDPAEFVPGARRDIDDLDGYIDFLVLEIHHDGLRSLCEAVLGEPGFRERFRTAPATESGHHSYAGGLAEHTVAVAALCRESAQLHPRLDADLLTAAALLHDCGCVDSFVGGAVILTSERGALLGHVHLGLARIERAASRVAIDDARLQPLLGAVASHHGPPESRRFPSPEAVALHAANALDARVNDAL
jgi:3'-5' exoribonuclease